MATPGPPPAGTSFLGTIAVVLLAIAALFGVDTFLASMEQSESRTDAARLFQEGRHLMEQGHNVDAVRRFQAALAMSRRNPDYQLALAQALLAAGRLADAENALSDLLLRNSTDGAGNLTMARVLVKGGRIPEATAYFHRAIFGQWKDDPTGNRLQARFELVDLLSRQDLKVGLLAELLPLEEEAPHDTETRKRMGRLFLAAGSPARGAEIFRDVLRHSPQDPDARAGLGEAEFARGNYRAAQSDFQAALKWKPDDTTVRNNLEACDRVLELDPTRRGLAPGERYRRSLKLIELTLEGVSQCAGATIAQDELELIDDARKTVKRPVTPSHQADEVDANLDLAEQLWQIRKKECKQPQAHTEEPLALVLARIAQ